MQNEPAQDEDLTPTPTQAENDRAKLGGQSPVTAEEPGAKPAPGAKANREVKAAAGAQYETR